MDSWVVGVDCHAQTLTAVRVDALGRTQGERTVPNTGAGQQQVQRWAAVGVGPRAWAVEGAGGHGRELTRRLQRAGERVHEIPGWVTARERRHDGRRDKSDAQDALAAARALQREPERPMARPEDGATMLRLLADERDALVQERTRLINQLRAGVRAIGAEVSGAVGALGRPVGAHRVLALPLSDPDPVQRLRRALAHRLAQRLLPTARRGGGADAGADGPGGGGGDLAGRPPRLPGADRGAAAGRDGRPGPLWARGKLRAVLRRGAAPRRRAGPECVTGWTGAATAS